MVVVVLVLMLVLVGRSGVAGVGAPACRRAVRADRRAADCVRQESRQK